MGRRRSAALVVFGAFLLHLVVAWRSPTLAWPDEIFQTLEQGHRLAFGYGVVPWEFRVGLRSWFLPGLLGGVMRATAPLGRGSAGYLLGVDVFLAAASVVPVIVTCAWAERAKLRSAWLAGLVCAIWFELAFFAGKALTEVFAGYALAPALYFTWRARNEPGRRLVFAAAAAWGLVVGLRLHLAPAALVAFVWLARRDFGRWRDALLGGAAVIAAFGLLDALTWSYPFQSFLVNLRMNLGQGKAASYGVSPLHEYVGSLLETWGLGAAPLLAAGALAFRRLPLLGLTALAIFVSHSAIGHKEYRFLAPLIVVLAMAAGLGVASLVERERVLGWVTAGLLLVASADGARRYDWRTLAPRAGAGAFGRTPLWTLREGVLRSYAALSTRDDVCGIATVGIGWAFSGGYTYLHKDVNVFEIFDPATFKARAASFNVVVAEAGASIKPPYEKERCWNDACLYVRPGGCADAGDYTINRWLAERGL